MKTDEFEKHLRTTNYAESTIRTYVSSIRQFSKYFDESTKTNCLAYKAMLCESYTPQTINSRIRAINLYNDWMGLDFHLSFVKQQTATFLDDVICEADYKHLCRMLKKDKKTDWYFLVKFMGMTGARISEILKLRGEHIVQGYADIFGKGNKMRRIYIPKRLQKEAISWKSEGLLWDWSANTINSRLKDFGKDYKIDPVVLHCHSFRHFFAKQFIAKKNDIALLADLLGHSSLEITRRYLTKTSVEQKEIVDNVIDW